MASYVIPDEGYQYWQVFDKRLLGKNLLDNKLSAEQLFYDQVLDEGSHVFEEEIFPQLVEEFLEDFDTLVSEYRMKCTEKGIDNIMDNSMDNPFSDNDLSFDEERTELDLE